MNFLRNLFGKKTSATTNGNYSPQASRSTLEDRISPKQLVDELISIGRTKGYLPREPGRTREIGEELNRIGGINLMQMAHEQIYSSLGNVKARELESAWAGIGSWQG